MTAFQYQALDANGKTRKGVLSADSLRLARRDLQGAGLTPLSIESMGREVGEKKEKASKFSKGDVVLATRQLATLVKTSTPVEEALNAVASQMDKPGVRGPLLSIRARVMEGWRLSDALGEHPKAFNELYRGIIASGETSGDLGGVMTRLADMLEKNQAMLMKAITALIYPFVLMLVALGVVSGLMVFVVPKIVEQFDSLGADLPLITRFVIGVSNYMQTWGLLTFGAVVLSVTGFWRAMKLPRFRLMIDQLMLRLPVVGKLSRGLDSARFARTLSTLFASGTPLLDCLQSARRTVVNSYIREGLGETLTSVREGASLSAGLRKCNAFPPMMIYMVAAGERSGELPAMLDNTALNMENEFDTATTLALRLLEPLIIVGMGVVVLIIVLAIILPILQLNTLVSG